MDLQKMFAKLTAAGLIGICGALGAADMLSNGIGSFEEWKNDFPAGMTENKVFKGGTAEKGTGDAADGKSFLRVTTAPDKPKKVSFALMSLRMTPAVEGDTVKYSLAVRGKGVFRMEVYCYSAKGVGLNRPVSLSEQAVDSEKWQTFTFEKVLPDLQSPRGTIGKVRAVFYVLAGSKLDFDAFKAEVSRPGEAPKPAAEAKPAEAPKPFAPAASELKLDLPPIIYAAPGIEANIYFASVFNAIVPENFVYLVKCAKGKLQDARWCWTPEAKDAGTKVPLSLEVRDDRGVIARAECEVRVAAPMKDPKRKITLALLAASSVGSGYPQFIMETMHANGIVNYTPVGTYHRCGLPPKPGLALSDGYGGWAWTTFLRQYAYSVRELESVQDEAEKEHMKVLGVKTVNLNNEYKLRSPLLKMEKGKVVRDVQGWFDRINGGKAPDFILIDLGGNDVFGPKTDEQARAKLEKEILPAMTELTDLLRKAAPDATIGICQQAQGSRSQTAFGANYGCSQSRWQFQRNKRMYNALVARFVAARNDPEIIVLPYFQNIDPVNGYPSKMLPPNAREGKVKVPQYVNALHTTPSGAHQIADAMYCWLVNQLSRKGW